MPLIAFKGRTKLHLMWKIHDWISLFNKIPLWEAVNSDQQLGRNCFIHIFSPVRISPVLQLVLQREELQVTIKESKGRKTVRRVCTSVDVNESVKLWLYYSFSH